MQLTSEAKLFLARSQFNGIFMCNHQYNCLCILIDDYKISVCVLGLTTYCSKLDSSNCFEYTWISFTMDYNLNLDFGIFTSVLLSMATLVKDPGLNQKSASEGGGAHFYSYLFRTFIYTKNIMHFIALSQSYKATKIPIEYSQYFIGKLVQYGCIKSCK